MIENYSAQFGLSLRKCACICRMHSAFNLTHISRIPDYPMGNDRDVVVLFYVTHPILSTTVLQKVLASMLVAQETELERVLNQEVELQTPGTPYPPPIASSDQVSNSVVIRILSFKADLVSWVLMIYILLYVTLKLSVRFTSKFIIFLSLALHIEFLLKERMSACKKCATFVGVLTYYSILHARHDLR